MSGTSLDLRSWCLLTKEVVISVTMVSCVVWHTMHHGYRHPSPEPAEIMSISLNSLSTENLATDRLSHYCMLCGSCRGCRRRMHDRTHMRQSESTRLLKRPA